MTNIFYNKTISEELEKQEKFMQLIARIKEDPDVLYTLSLETLEDVSAYYEEECRKLEKRIDMLNANLIELRAKSEEEGDAE